VVFLGTVGAVAAAVVAMFSHPHSDSIRGQKIRYMFWEIGVLIPVVLLLWMNKYGSVSSVWYLEPLFDSGIVSRSGHLEFGWGPLFGILMAFSARDYGAQLLAS
jgi:hypothetical protein